MTTGEITSLVVGVVTGTLPAVAAFILALRHGWQISDLQGTADAHTEQIDKLKDHTKCTDLPPSHKPAKRQAHHNSHLNGG